MNPNSLILVGSSTDENLQRIETKINSFQELEDGWDFGEGKAISEIVSYRAYLLAIDGLNMGYNVDVRPAPDNSIILNFFHEDNFLYIKVNSKSYGFIYEKGIGEDYSIVEERENLNKDNVIKILKQYANQWFLLEHFTFGNTIQIVNDSQAIALTKWETESPYLLNIVPYWKVAQSVPIYTNTTQPLWETQLSTAN